MLFLEGAFTRNKVNDRLLELLPRYMMPSNAICMERLPLNANGKINWVKLAQEYIN